MKRILIISFFLNLGFLNFGLYANDQQERAELSKLIIDKNETVLRKVQAIEKLGWMGPKAKDSVPTLFTLFSDQNPFMRWKAVEAVGKIKEIPEEGIEKIKPLLRDPHKTVRGRAVTALGDIGPLAKAATAELIQRLEIDVDLQVRISAAGTLAKIGTKEGVRALIKASKEQQSYLRSEVIAALSKVREPKGHATEIIPAISRALLSDPEPEIRMQAAQALGSLIEHDSKKGISDLVDSAVNDGDPRVRAKIAQVMGRFPSEAFKKEGVKKLTSKLKEPSPSLQERASEALTLLREELTTEENEREIFEDLFKMTKKTKLPNICDILCKHLSQPALWLPDSGRLSFAEASSARFMFALDTLSSLFLVKLRQLCRSDELDRYFHLIANHVAEERQHIVLPHRKEISDSVSPPCSAPPSEAEEMQNFLIQSLLRQPYALYGKIYYIHLLKALLKEKGLDDSTIQKLKALLYGNKGQKKVGVEQSLRLDLKESENIVKTYETMDEKLKSASIFNTYTLSAALLSVPDVDGLNTLKKLLSGPLRSAYRPGSEIRAAEAGTGRMVPIQLSLYLDPSEAKNQHEHRENLKKTVKFYIDQYPFIWLQKFRSTTHLGRYGLAPYYLYPSLPYATAAVSVLLRNATDEKEKKELEEMKQQLKEYLLSLWDEDKNLFQEARYLPFTNENAMGGLALLPFAEDCLKGQIDAKQSRRLPSILDE